jgi:hypothetical protein
MKVEGFPRVLVNAVGEGMNKVGKLLGSLKGTKSTFSYLQESMTDHLRAGNLS